MTIKEQVNKIKDNWLLIAAILVLMIFMSGTGQLLTSNTFEMTKSAIQGVSGGAYYRDVADGSYGNDNFAPEVEERVVIRDSYISTEVNRGEFNNAETKIKSILKTSDAFLLNEDVNQYDEGWKAYYTGYYQIKVPTDKYEAVISQLKDIGEVTSFSENAIDVTGTYTTLESDLELEKARLLRYEEMFNDAIIISDKIVLNDRIFDQERRIKYLKESIDNIDKKVDYSQISLTLNEKRSEYVDIAVVKFSELIMRLVGSFNTLISLVFMALPWLVLYLIFKFVTKKK
ncbi:MAG: DUF4349 domain-containing protein [Nanoarchaeota archaeon]